MAPEWSGMRKRPDGVTFPPHLRSPEAYREHVGGRTTCSLAWHDARISWLKAHRLKGTLTEIRAMTNPEIYAKLIADPDYSIGGPRRLYPR
jgi:hypothetical protein